MRSRPRLSYANVMSTIAVFLALGGSAYAVKRIDGKDIAPRTVPAGKLKRDSLTRQEIGPRAIGRSELSRALRAALRPDEEPEFPGPEPFPGEPGPPGEPGEPGEPGTACDPAGLRLCPDDELPAGTTVKLTVAGVDVRVEPAYRAGCAGDPVVCTVLVRGALPVPPEVNAWQSTPRNVQLTVQRSTGAVVEQLAGANGRPVGLVRHGDQFDLAIRVDALVAAGP